MSAINQQAENFYQNSKRWHALYHKLRLMILSNPSLTEDFKWKHPCYTLKGKNVLLVHGFKEYCAILFHKGALMKDPQNILIQQTENVQAARQIRFQTLQQLEEMQDIIIQYIQEAVQVEQSGAQVTLKKVEAYPVPTEFEQALTADAVLKKAFQALTPGRQKGYLFYFNQAKQAKTRIARIEKSYPKIMQGKGFDELN